MHELAVRQARVARDALVQGKVAFEVLVQYVCAALPPVVEFYEAAEALVVLRAPADRQDMAL